MRILVGVVLQKWNVIFLE